MKLIQQDLQIIIDGILLSIADIIFELSFKE